MTAYDIKAFATRASFLSKWKLNILLVDVAAAPISAVLDAHLPYASPLAAWFSELLKIRIPTAIKDELSFATQLMLGLATSPSLDAVVVAVHETRWDYDETL